MAGIIYDRIVKYIISAVCDGPVHIGSSSGNREDVLVHPVEESPFIQASSIAGVFRDTFAQNNHSEAEIDDLFGASKVDENSNAFDYRSRIKFSDGIFDMNTVKMEIRPHVKIDRVSGSVSSDNGSGQKFDMEYVGKGAEFSFSIYLYSNSGDNNDNEKYVRELVSLFKNGEMNIGAKKSSGAGNISAKKVLMRVFDMKSASDRKAWKDEEILVKTEYKDITGELVSAANNKIAYKVMIKGSTEGALLVKGIATSKFGAGAPDSENIKNAKEEYIIPGSSLRGSLRSRMEKICDYIGKKSIIDLSFGVTGEGKNTGMTGNLIFNDTVVDSTKIDKEMLRHRIHIDKFTGGVFSGGLFSESNIAGDVVLSINILNRNNADATLGLLVMGLRDLAVKNMNLGSGYATGKGFINVAEIVIESNTEKAVVKFGDSSSIDDAAGIIKKALKALEEVA